MKVFSFASVVAVLAVFVAQAAALDFTPVAVSGRPTGDPLGPQLGTGIDWGLFPRAVINNTGQVAFKGNLDPNGTDSAIWRWENNAKQLLARTGSQAPGLPIGVLVSNVVPAGLTINETGAVTMARMVLGGTATSSSDTAIVSIHANGSPALIAREGDTATGLGPLVYGDNFTIPSEVGTSDTGKVYFRGTLAGPGVSSQNDRVLWYGNAANPTPLFREGAPIPAFGPDAKIASISGALGYIKGDQTVFQIPISDGDTSSVLYAGSQGSLTPIVVEDQLISSLGESVSGFRNVRINQSGSVLFNAGASNSGSGVFVHEGGLTHAIALEGQPAPGTSEVFGQLDESGLSRVALTQLGEVAFYGNLTANVTVDSLNDTGLWIHSSGTTSLAVREGENAPGLSDITLGSIHQWAFNDSQDLVFVTDLEGAVSENVNDIAVWHAAANGSLSKLLQTGDQFDVDPTAADDFRTISGISLGGTASSGAQSTEMGLTDSRLLLLSLNFSDGTNGLFITSLNVPEPASLALLVLSATVLATVRRRHA